jgi:hypothetical protein
LQLVDIGPKALIDDPEADVDVNAVMHATPCIE